MNHDEIPFDVSIENEWLK